MPEVEMTGSSLDLSKIRQLLVESLDDAVKWHSSVDAFRTLGLDIRSQEPFRRACSAVRDHVAELDTFDAR